MINYFPEYLLSNKIKPFELAAHVGIISLFQEFEK
jgi:hypothetical protein